jgi:hypothetical protein
MLDSIDRCHLRKKTMKRGKRKRGQCERKRKVGYNIEVEKVK